MELYGLGIRNFAGFKDFASLPVWTDSKGLEDRKLVFDMNKRTKAVDEETYKMIVSVMKEGFCYQGVDYKPNKTIATVLILEYNIELRAGNILNLTVSFVKDGSRYRLDIYEQKTGTEISLYQMKCISSYVIMPMNIIFRQDPDCFQLLREQY